MRTLGIQGPRAVAAEWFRHNIALRANAPQALPPNRGSARRDDPLPTREARN